jgi:hypothetical protein
MGHALQRRNLLIMKKRAAKVQNRKMWRPLRGIKNSLQEQNQAVLDSLLARVKPVAEVKLVAKATLKTGAKVKAEANPAKKVKAKAAPATN